MPLLLIACLLVVQDEPTIKDPHVRELAEKIDKGGTTASIEAMKEAAKLGADAKPLFQRIVQAMTSNQKDVRKAAYDALQALDVNLYDTAVKLIVTPDHVDLEAIYKQGPDVVIPLAPLLVRQVEEMLHVKNVTGFEPKSVHSYRCLVILFEQAPRDPLTRKIVLKALKSPVIGFQYRAMMGACAIKDGQEGLPDIIRIGRVQSQENVRITAIQTVVSLCDDKHKDAILKMLYELRRDQNENVRREVEEALTKLKEK